MKGSLEDQAELILKIMSDRWWIKPKKLLCIISLVTIVNILVTASLIYFID